MLAPKPANKSSRGSKSFCQACRAPKEYHPPSETELEPLADETLGHYIRHVRQARGLNLPDVARALAHLPPYARVSHPYLSQIELGQVHQPSRDRLISLAGVLSIRTEWLLAKAGYCTPSDQAAPTSSPFVRQIMLRVEQLSPADQKLLLSLLDAIVRQRRAEARNRS